MGHIAFFKLAAQKQIAEQFQVHRNTVSAALQTYRRGDGVKKTPQTKAKSWTAIDEETGRRLGELLAQGRSIRSAAIACRVNHETVRRYVHAGRIPGFQLESPQLERPAATPAEAREDSRLAEASDRTERDQNDRQAAMGMGAQDIPGRVAASIGEHAGPKPHFSAARAVKQAGVLVALPALLETGLLRHLDQLPESKGYYRPANLLLFLALMFLTRVCSVEQMRYQSPGEWGKILGSDRSPEVTTLRRRIRQLATSKAMDSWQSNLAKDWLSEDPEETATLYLDGHVKVYHGRKGNLPRHFVSRQKLCLPAAVSSWLHALGGTPLLCLHQQIDSKMIQTLKQDILPQLRELGLLPANSQEPASSTVTPPVLNLIFDREGWSPKLFGELARQGVACITWRKGKVQPWSEQEFVAREVRVPGPCGSVIRRLSLAEKPLELRGWDIKAREIRCLRSDGRQSSIITTNNQMDINQVAGSILSRWSQENFFLYARREFGLDHLPVHELEPVDPAEKVVNPPWRRLKTAIAKLKNRLGHLTRRIDAQSKTTQPVGKLQTKKIDLAKELQELCQTQKSLPEHVKAGDLSPSEQLEALPRPVRQFYDLIRMIVYRAETALTPLVNGDRKGRPHSRSLLKSVFKSEADILPDEANGELVIRLLNQSNKAQNQALKELLEALNQKEIRFPETNLKLVYKLAD